MHLICTSCTATAHTNNFKGRPENGVWECRFCDDGVFEEHDTVIARDIRKIEIDNGVQINWCVVI